MKSLFCFSILFFFVFNCKSQSYEIDMNGKDTVNRMDIKHQKQGNWKIRGRDKKRSCFELSQTIETGQYTNNRKTGIWIEYYCNGKTRSKLTYDNGVLDGAAIFYNEKGEVLKEGNFKANKWENKPD